MLDRGLQPILLDVGHLALGCCGVVIDSVLAGSFNNISLQIDSSKYDVKTGFPSRVRAVQLMTMQAKAEIELEELGGLVRELITEIVNSLGTLTVPVKDVDLEIFRPRGPNILAGLRGYLHQSFSLNFTDEFSNIPFTFEAFGAAEDLVTFNELSQTTFSARPWTKEVGNISIGKPKITINGVSIGAIQGAELTLTTEYKRVETGYPATLKHLIPTAHYVDCVVASEEFNNTSLSELLSVGETVQLTYEVPLVGSDIPFRLRIPECKQLPGNLSLKQQDFSAIEKRFFAVSENDSSPILTLF